jgi:hypothetical protein
MMKMFANGTKNGKRVRLVVFGLSHGNLDRLREGRPINFNGETCGLSDDIEILIFADETEQAMQRKFADMIGPNTEVHIDPRLRE